MITTIGEELKTQLVVTVIFVVCSNRHTGSVIGFTVLFPADTFTKYSRILYHQYSKHTSHFQKINFDIIITVNSNLTAHLVMPKIITKGEKNEVKIHLASLTLK